MTDDLTLILPDSNRAILGWQGLRVTRGIERLPSDFDIMMTEVYPDADDLTIQPGDACQVKLGDDLVITGYVDRAVSFLSARRHEVRISGRGKCADLVDCSAEWTGGQISGSTVLGIAQKLSSPYDIDVTLSGVEAGNPILQFNLNWSETPYEIIERLARYHALLVYDGPDGNLILARVGSSKAGSAIRQGENVENATTVFSADQRFSDYIARSMPVSHYGDTLPAGADVIGAAVKDAGVKRHRLRYIVAEQVAYGLDLVDLRARWECTRRFGRAAQLVVTVDSWRDGAGALWQPNTLVDVDIPALKAAGKTWLIGEVTYMRDLTGTHAVLTIMPPEAFDPEPSLLPTVLPADIVQPTTETPR